MFHPAEVRPIKKDLNYENIQALNSASPQNTYKFIVAGDMQRFYEELDAFIEHVNSAEQVSFVLLDGDLVDFGLNTEYNWVVERLSKLDVPFITALGNHDMLGNGKTIFNKMFGPENFTFQFGDDKVIVINTNSLETGFNGKVPDIAWLQQQMDDHQSRNIFVLSHVAPFSKDFDSQLASAFYTTLASNSHTRASLHGHDHQYSVSTPGPRGIPYLVTGAGNDRNYALVTVTDTAVTIEKKIY